MADIKYLTERVPLHKVNVLPQVRITFDPLETRELADDIALNGVIQPSILAKLTSDEMQAHLDFVNKLKGCSLKLEDMKKTRLNRKTFYYYLIAGERRYRAYLLLYDHGCSNCKKEGRSKHDCYMRHMGTRNLMDARVCIRIGPLEAKSIQFRENNHRRPPDHEEAYAYAEMFHCLRLDNPKYPMTEFAEFVGVGVDKARKRLLFTELPENIRMLVEGDVVSMGHALEFRRILELKGDTSLMVQKQIEYLILVPRVTLDTFRERVTQIIENLNQASMFEEGGLLGMKQRRGVVASNLIPGLALHKTYLDRVIMLASKGMIGKGKAFSGQSPGRWVEFILGSLEKIIPNFKLTKTQRLALAKLDLERSKHNP